MADSMSRPRSVSPSSIRALLNKEHEAANDTSAQEESLQPEERADPLPRPGEPYRVHGRKSNKPLMTLSFVLKDFAYEGFSYADFERVRLVPGDRPGSGLVLSVRFSGSEPTEVIIEGRDLHLLYHLIGLHLVGWVWEHPGTPEFAEEGGPIIRRITLQEPKR